ncbi:Transposon Ty3-I Gag-Pol polyprotein [Gossypium australe]|uniref:Transposon Ty3-I Gag-Pol polyprotein n=1 Tax=Gossypium australe TaxID=47621 RepID=A0A5B6WZA4_9ROSI|nr:Transposon Ty3-I Gag-Pol polyprotein [Gossypium australe]
MPGAVISNRPAYRKNPEGNKELQRQVNKLMEKGYILESLSPCVVPVLLVPKKDGTWWIYHLIHLHEGDEWKTAFKTKHDLYEWLVMPFGLTNAPSTFMRLMNYVLRPFIGKFCVVYFDDILIYSKLLEEHVLHLKSFLETLLSSQGLETFELECDASGVGIGVILTQDGRPIAYFREKLNGSPLNYLVYDKEMHALVQAFETWQHYLWPKEFVIHSDHKLNKRHAKWVEYLESFPYLIKYKKGKDNVVADALSRRYTLLSSLESKLLGFSFLKDLYANDADFGEIYSACENTAFENFYRYDGFLFKEGKLCIPQSSGYPIIRKNLKSWEKCLPHIEFAYNRSVHTATKHSPFEVVYGFNPLTPLDLLPLPNNQLIHSDARKKVDFVKRLHQKVQANIEARTESYVQRANKGRKRVVFVPGNWVWVHTSKEGFPAQWRSKLLPRGDKPFQVLERINENPYKLDLPGEYNISTSFNVSDLSLFYANFNLRTSRFEEEGNDVSTPGSTTSSTLDPLELPKGPMTRARAKLLQEAVQLYSFNF